MQEAEILQSLSHKGVVGYVSHGKEGVILKQSGKELTDLVYIIMEYVQGYVLYDLCKDLGSLGEEAARYFAT